MTTLIAYHQKTEELALFNSDGKIWIGAFCPHMTHQNGEPLYYFISGYFESEEEGLKALHELPEDAS